jgi:hypothetical protein
MRDLIAHDPACTLRDVMLAKVGRHYRLSPTAKAVVGRDAAENGQIAALRDGADVLLEARDVSGPTTLLRGTATAADVEKAALLTVVHGKARGGEAVVVSASGAAGGIESVTVTPRGDEEYERWRIGGRGQ